MGHRLFNLRMRLRHSAGLFRNRLRRLVLRMVLGSHTYDLMYRCLLHDLRLRNAHTVDLIIRKDAREKRIQADWVSQVARIIHDEKRPPPPTNLTTYRAMREGCAMTRKS